MSKKPQKILIKLFALLLVIILVGNFVKLIVDQWDVYTRPFYPNRYKVLKDLYDKSQYVKAYSPINIPDEYYYALAGWNYLYGMDPILYNGEQPPLGKYFVSVTIQLFNNETLTGPVFNVLCLLMLFLLGILVLKSKLWSLVMTTLFGFETLFQVQMRYVPLLDNIQLFFVILSFYLFLLWIDKKVSVVFPIIALGLIASVKFWITAAVIYIVWILSIFLYQRKSLLIFLISTPVLFLVLLSAYLPSLLYGDSIRRVIGVQKYIYAYHSGKFHFDPLAFFDLLLFNHWHVTWENTIKPSVDFQITWPILLILSIFAVLKLFRRYKLKKNGYKNIEIKIVALWFIIYVIFLFFGTILARYLIPVLPAMYLLSFYVIKEFVKK